MRHIRPQPGATRRMCAFLWWPREIQDEWRFWERACWTEKCHRNIFTGGRFWVGMRWEDEEDDQ